MRNVEKIKDGSCQITFLPLCEQNPDHAVNRVLTIIEKADVESEVGAVSTLIRGKPDQIFSLLQEIYEIMEAEGFQFSMNLLVSNHCGCSK
jgi:uncharacterized protein YqgV (UPF0045/DUF77 family)